MTNECLICNSRLEYLASDELMECIFCHKQEYNKVRCENNHYICDECHMQGIDSIMDICLKEKSRNPIDVLNRLMNESFCHMHGPEHHILVGASLLTAYNNCVKEIDLEKSLIEMINRGKKVPGGTCGYWGACGAGISSGIFISIISDSTPLSHKPFKLANLMTSNVLSRISEYGGPRCCKRDSYLSILEAIDFVEEHFNVNMEKNMVFCDYSEKNNQCIENKCPFHKEY